MATPVLVLSGRVNVGIPGAFSTKSCRSSENEVATSARDGYFLRVEKFASGSNIMNDLHTNIKNSSHGREG